MDQGNEDLSLLAPPFLEDLTDCRNSDLATSRDELRMKPVAGDALFGSRCVLPLLDDRLDDALGFLTDRRRVLLRPTVRWLSVFEVFLDCVATALELSSDLPLANTFPVKLPSESETLRSLA